MGIENEKENDTDWWWVDYLEGEFEEELKDDLEVLLSFSETNRAIVRDLEITKSIVGSSDPAHDVVMESVDWDKLHKKIMSKYDEEQKEEDWKKRKHGSVQSRSTWQ